MNGDQLRIKYFKQDDYPMICSWWAGHGWNQVPFQWLPQTGIIVEVDSIPQCAGFIYKTDSEMAIFEYVVSNPKASIETKNAAFDALIDSACLVAKGLGASAVFSAFGHKKLSERMVKHDFKIIGTEVTNLLRSL